MTQPSSVLTVPPISPLLRIRSAYYRCWYEVSRGFTWIRREYREDPVHTLPESLTAQQRQRIESLQDQYGVQFENQFQSSTALDNYEYLDMLHQVTQILDWRPQADQSLVDVGSLNFYYAPAIHAFFRPRQLAGIEIEGYRVYTNFYSRFDYAQYYIRGLPNTSYTVMDFCEYGGSVDGITCFYPFVIPDPLVAWRLPLKVYRPQRLFARMEKSLNAQGFLLMLNHGKEEAGWACEFAQRSGFQGFQPPQALQPLFPRSEIPIISLWHKD
ncbi:MAG: hypothetical protein MRJ96_06680 [Nitrospirales bacterium]|nr:hypothetical protein [Nitrospira sp.]MDR4501119.1 hypothetical protein [Nitrospirales bacterium]